MIIAPELQALRSDDAAQRRVQGAFGELVKAWRASPAFTGIDEQFHRYAQGAALDSLPLLAGLFDPADQSATRPISNLVARMVNFVAQNPLAHVPLRHQVDDQGAALVLCNSGGAVMLVQMIDGPGLDRRAAPGSVAFTPGDTFERVLAGRAETLEVTLERELPGKAELGFAARRIRAGDVLRRDGSRQSQIVRKVDGALVSLKLQRRATAGTLAREFALDDGRFLRQAAASARETRLELAAALLGRMGRTDAAPLLAAMAQEQAGQSLRWQSLKECLGLDTAIGFSALSAIAADQDDALASPAGALKAQLLETYPVLQGLLECPA